MKNSASSDCFTILEVKIGLHQVDSTSICTCFKKNQVRYTSSGNDYFCSPIKDHISNKWRGFWKKEVRFFSRMRSITKTSLTFLHKCHIFIYSNIIYSPFFHILALILIFSYFSHHFWVRIREYGEEFFLTHGLISKKLSPFCNNYFDSRYMMLSLIPICQRNKFASFSK